MIQQLNLQDESWNSQRWGQGLERGNIPVAPAGCGPQALLRLWLHISLALHEAQGPRQLRAALVFFPRTRYGLGGSHLLHRYSPYLVGFCKVPPEDAGCQQWLRWGEHHGDEWILRLGLQSAIQLIPSGHSVQTSLCWDTRMWGPRKQQKLKKKYTAGTSH